ncbi:Sapep family Mn(2+)-dependent dipeptidase [Metamycoplasma cloacale]|uniref:M20/M25/M40 family metallo-hydrolase n=1 Tax=Metamycoplasma cloacale TaxID=92401 RepID=A0A2Z4LMP8_9BACT|nr:Sapep family Mn(2+)-dependent dipeptidase [Metamycoplasma cloacale]AWX43000.1 M20/M25/M40 family metallo-hydrolase [Metamycoplasma cloacale]
MKKYIHYQQNDVEFKEMVQHIANICAIKSVSEENLESEYPFGIEVDKACNYALNLGKSFGFKTYKDPKNRYGYVEIGEGEKQIGIMAHLDVVPSGDESQWISDAFKPLITENEIFGRGSLDDKGPAIINIYAMKYIKDNNLLAKDWSIRLIFGLSEETTMKSMKFYLQDFPAPYIAYTPDGEWPLIYAEKLVYHVQISFPKIANLDIHGGDVINQIPDRVSIKNLNHKLINIKDSDLTINTNEVIVKGIGGHGSTPHKGDNAILKLLKSLALIEECKNSSVLKFIQETFQGTFEMNNVFPNFTDFSGSLSANLGMIRTTDKTLDLSFDLRVPVSHSKEVSNLLETYLNNLDKNISVKLLGYKPAKYIPKDDPLVSILMDTYNEKHNANEEPLAIGGGTYARLLDQCVAFGSTKMMHLMHGPNEAFSFTEIRDSLEIYINALNRLQEYKK